MILFWLFCFLNYIYVVDVVWFKVVVIEIYLYVDDVFFYDINMKVREDKYGGDLWLL